MDLEVELYIQRVPTKENLADDLSRERYDLLHEIGVCADLRRPHVRAVS